MAFKPVPADGILGEAALREAATEFRDIIDLVRRALEQQYGQPGRDIYVPLEAIYPDRVICNRAGRYYAHPYTLGEDNQVTLGAAQEVTREFTPVRMFEAAQGVFLEALDPPAVGSVAAGAAVATGAEPKGTRWRIRVIRAGASGNSNYYPDATLREAVPLFDGARVFVKSDEEHIAGKGKDVRNLIGKLSEPRFVEGNGTDTGEVQATLHLLASAGGIPARLLEAHAAGMADLFGFSIDAQAKIKRRGKFREAAKFLKVHSVDLIVEPGAGGQVINLIEAIDPHGEQLEKDMALRERMIEAIKTARGGALPDGLDTNNDEALEQAFREAVGTNNAATAKSQDATQQGALNAGGNAGGAQAVTREDLQATMRMVEARSHLRVAVAESGLPDLARERVRKQFDQVERFTEADVDSAIAAERDYLARLTESGRVQGLGDTARFESGQDRSEKVTEMLDAFFDPSKPVRSFREAYVEITGDRHVTGLINNCDLQRLREAVGEARMTEAVSASTFSNVLGNSITRAMLREYNTQDYWTDWRWLVDVVPVTDFRTQERTRMGGYGNLPPVAENGAYAALTTPGDEKATYALTKRGGTETLSLEAVANDDVGLIRRLPVKLGTAAKRTLYEFVFDFIDDNAAIYDTNALFHASHNNLATGALASATFAAMRLAMFNQAELSSAKKLGLILRHLAVPVTLEETAFDLFVRGTNNDETFVQSRKPMVHVVPYWTDANNWYGFADKAAIPMIEVGFYGGNEEPEIFVQDNPTQGSLFSNDQIKYKIRHIYSGAVADFRGFQGAIVV